MGPVTVEKGMKQAILAIVVRDGKILLGRRRNPPTVWSPPAGFVEPGETKRQAVLREVREETGFGVEALYPLGAFDWRDTRVSVWAVKPVGSPRLSDREHLAWVWATPEEIGAGRFKVSPEPEFFELALEALAPKEEREVLEKAQAFAELLSLAENRYPVYFMTNKKRLLRWILREIPKDAEWVGDLFAGSGVVSYALKARGHKVVCNDLSEYAQACLKGIVANEDTVLSEEDIDSLYKPTDHGIFIPDGIWTAKVRRVMTDYWHNAQKLPGRKKWVALALGASAVAAMFHWRIPEPGFLKDTDHKSRVERANARLEKMLVSGEVKVYKRDALELAGEISVDALYLDPPYPGRKFAHPGAGGASRMWLAQECWVKGDFSDFDQRKEYSDWDDLERKVPEMLRRLFSAKAKTIVMSFDAETDYVRRVMTVAREFGETKLKRRLWAPSVTGLLGEPQTNKERLLVLSKRAKIKGEGPEGSIAFVGISPGREEMEAGRPFVGPSGEALEELYLNPLGLKREEVFLTNVFPFAVFDDAGRAREPTIGELDEEWSWIERELERAKPVAIVALGLLAAQRLTLQREPEHGWHETGFGPVFFTFHPSAVRRFPSLQEALERDLELLRQGLKLRGIAKAEEACYLCLVSPGARCPNEDDPSRVECGAAAGCGSDGGSLLKRLFRLVRKLRLVDMKDPKVLERVSDAELLSGHRRLHQWYAQRPGDEEVLNAHVMVVREMLRRGLEHRTEDLDRLDRDTFALAPDLKGKREAGPIGIAAQILFEGAEDFIIVPEFISLTGSAVYPQVRALGREPNDVDVVVRSAFPDPKVEIKLVKWVKAATGKQVHIVYEPAGPNFGYVPVFDLAAVKIPRLEYRQPREEAYADRYYAQSTFN